MKVSKALLQTIAAGLLVSGSLQSCSKEAIEEYHHDENCTANCEIDHTSTDSETWDCPPCGMG